MAGRSAIKREQMPYEMDAINREAHAKVEFKNFRILLPHVQEVQHSLEVLRRVGKQSKGKEQEILPIIGPSHSGKSTIIKDFRERIYRKETPRPGWHPVVHVTLTPKATIGSLGSDIIKGMKDCALPQPVIDDLLNMRGQRGTKESASAQVPDILHVAARALCNAETELLILDEVHHLAPSETAVRTRYNVTEAIKWLGIQGVCPIVCVGINKLHDLFSANTNSQITNRAIEPIFIDPFDFGTDEGFITICGFIDALDNKLVEHGIFPTKSDLIQSEWTGCFYDVSKGVLGRISRIVEVAAVNAIRKGRFRIELEDLELATSKWAIRMKVTTYNPWIGRGLPRDFEEIRKEALLVE